MGTLGAGAGPSCGASMASLFESLGGGAADRSLAGMDVRGPGGPRGSAGVLRVSCNALTRTRRISGVAQGSSGQRRLGRPKLVVVVEVLSGPCCKIFWID